MVLTTAIIKELKEACALRRAALDVDRCARGCGEFGWDGTSGVALCARCSQPREDDEARVGISVEVLEALIGAATTCGALDGGRGSL
jgi:hypothetical protein